MIKLLRETDNRDERTLDATAPSGGVSLFTLAGGHRRAVMMGQCLAGTAVTLRIPNLSCTAAVVEGMFWRKSVPLLFVLCFLRFLIPIALDLAVFTFSRSTV